jgi:hypothetical protein
MRIFFESAAMLATVGVYTFAAASGAPAVASIVTVGIFELVAPFLVSWKLPPVTQKFLGEPKNNLRTRRIRIRRAFNPAPSLGFFRANIAISWMWSSRF